jgi:hypothetical protein
LDVWREGLRGAIIEIHSGITVHIRSDDRADEIWTLCPTLVLYGQ